MGLRIEYPEVGKRRGVTVAEFWSPTEAKQQAGLLMNTLISSYQKQFEGGRHPRLPKGTVKRAYGIRNYRTHLSSHFQHGGQLVAVRNSEIENELSAFCAVAYAREILGKSYKGCYVKDVIAFPHRTGLGGVVLHAALKFGQFKLDEPVALHAFQGSSVNLWYEKHHILPVIGAAPEFYTFSLDHRIALTTYQTPETYCLSDVVTSLEKAYPYLVDGEPLAVSYE